MVEQVRYRAVVEDGCGGVGLRHQEIYVLADLDVNS